MPDMECVPTPDVYATIKAVVLKRCPVLDEVDDGIVTITYRTGDSAFELHALRTYLDGFAEQRMTHEQFTVQVADDLGVDVSSVWVTAGMEVTVALVRESVTG